GVGGGGCGDDGTDVEEAPRPPPGRKTGQGALRDRAPDQEDGDKRPLGPTERWKGDDLLRIPLEEPATSRRLAWRLCEWLMGEKAVGAAGLDALAAGLRAHDLDIGWAVETVLRSRVFFAEANLGTRVLGPVEFVVGVARALERFDPPPSCLVLGEWAARLGQDLFYPPNVFGWPGGPAWLTTQAVISRANYAAALVEGELSARFVPLDAIALAEKHGRGRGLEAVIGFTAELMTGAPPDAGWLNRLLAALGPRAMRQPVTARAAVALVAASPEVQIT